VVSRKGVPSEVLFGVYEAKRKASRPSLVYCGNDKRGKAVAVELIRDVGFDPVDAGPLRIARYTEPFGLLVAQLAYEGKGGPELTYGSSDLGNRGRHVRARFEMWSFSACLRRDHYRTVLPRRSIC
jgi:hypothetical protein